MTFIDTLINLKVKKLFVIITETNDCDTRTKKKNVPTVRVAVHHWSSTYIPTNYELDHVGQVMAREWGVGILKVLD